MKVKNKRLIILLASLLTISSSSFAKNKNDNANNYFKKIPKQQLFKNNLFTGAETLKFGHYFFSINPYLFVNRGKVDNDFKFEANENSFLELTPIATFGVGFLENFMLSASMPYKAFNGNEYSFTENNGIGDPWINLKYKLISEPVILSFQVDGKIPLGIESSDPSFGDGQFDLGGSILLSKYWKNFDFKFWKSDFFVQSSANYLYRLPFSKQIENEIQSIKYSDELNIIFDTGFKIPFDIPLVKSTFFNLTNYSTIPLTSASNNSFLISTRPNFLFKIAPKKNIDLDLTLSYSHILFGKNISTGNLIHAGLTYSNNFTLPKTFELFFSEKTDEEQLNKFENDSKYDFGKRTFINNCSKCHLLMSPNNYQIKKWESIIDRYKKKKYISNLEKISILNYLNNYINKDKKIK